MMIFEYIISQIANHPIISLIYRNTSTDPHLQQVALKIKKKEYKVSYKKFQTLNHNFPNRFEMNWFDNYPCLDDRTKTTLYDNHYIYHPAWAAQILLKINPQYHIDISSTVSFCSIVSVFIPIFFFDYRPAMLKLHNLSPGSVDIVHLPFKDYSIHCLSCMHTIEHIGLGRYGDNLDPEGDLKAIKELKRVLATGGNLIFVVPMGKLRLMFNAHRIYSYKQICQYFNDFELIEFSLIPDKGEKNVGIIYNATEKQSDQCSYGCGCFWFRKKPGN